MAHYKVYKLNNMQLHQLKPTHSKKKTKRIGRGGKRGTFSGRGSKGQKSRSGTRIRPGFRGGDNPIWKLFPKQRGASKKVDIKHKRFQVSKKKPVALNLDIIEKHFKTGETVSVDSLREKGIIRKAKYGVKILGNGKLTKKVIFAEGIQFSKSVRDQI